MTTPFNISSLWWITIITDCHIHPSQFPENKSYYNYYILNQIPNCHLTTIMTCQYFLHKLRLRNCCIPFILAYL